VPVTEEILSTPPVPAAEEAAPAADEPSVNWCGRVGELVVYPGQGVAQIEDFGSKELGGSTCEFLVLRMTSGASRIMIPVNKVKDVGLRPLMGTDEAERIWKILRTRPQGRSGRQTWIRQFREYQDRIKTGSVFDIAEVLRNLLLLQREKELSFGEHRVLDSARTLLAEELAAVERRTVDDVLTEIKQLAKA
jgi:CarD family transcriptional regulator